MPIAVTDPQAIEEAITALLEREDTAPEDACARLARVRINLEAQLADILAE